MYSRYKKHFIDFIKTYNRFFALFVARVGVWLCNWWVVAVVVNVVFHALCICDMMCFALDVSVANVREELIRRFGFLVNRFFFYENIVQTVVCGDCLMALCMLVEHIILLFKSFQITTRLSKKRIHIYFANTT